MANQRVESWIIPRWQGLDELPISSLSSPIAPVSTRMSLPAQQVVFNKQISKFTECSPTEYASHKVVPFTSIKQLGYGSLGIVDAVRPSGEEQGILLALKVIRLPGVARKRLLPLAQQEVAILKAIPRTSDTKISSPATPFAKAMRFS